MKIAFSGARLIPTRYHKQVISEIEKYQHYIVLVGDATGLDQLVRVTIKNPCVFHVGGYQRWQFAVRSQRMVDAADKLIAFPLKDCPEECTPKSPFSGHGSGTWGTIAYAQKKGLPIEIVTLDPEIYIPTWLIGEPLPSQNTGQLTLF